MATPITPEGQAAAKELIKEFVKIQKDKYGDDWKSILTKEMTDKSMPFVTALFKLQKKD